MADVADAISSQRPYRPSKGIASANREVAEGAGRFYDPEVVAAYLSPRVQALMAELYP